MNLIILFLLLAQQQPPQVASSLAEPSAVNSNLGQLKQGIYFFYNLIFKIRIIYLDFPPQNQVFGSQQWLSKLIK